MPKTLRQIRTKEVSLVTRGAVGKRFALKKEATEMSEQILKAVLEQEAEGEDAVRAELSKSGVSDKAADAMIGIVRLMSAFRDELPAEVLKKAPKMAGAVNDEAHDYAEGDGKFPGKKARKATKKGKAKAAEMPDDDGDEDEDEDEDEDKKFPPSKKTSKTMKSDDLPPEMRAHFEAVEKAQAEAIEKAARLERELHVERDARLTKEYVAKAEKEFRGLGPAAEVGEVLKALHLLGGELPKAVEKLLKTASERANTGALFAERGTDGSMRSTNGAAVRPDVEIWHQISKMAEGLIQKSGAGNLTREQAVSQVILQNPELYEQYRAAKAGV